MTRRLLALATTSLLASGAVVGLGAAPAAAAAGAPTDLLTAGESCARQAPGPYLSPGLLGAARAVWLEASYPGDTASAEVEGQFEVWDVASDQTRHTWRDRTSSNRIRVQLEDPSRQLDGVTYAWRARVVDGDQTSPWSATCYYTVDRDGGKAPVVSSEQYPAGSKPHGGPGVEGTFTMAAPSADTVSYEYRFASNEWGSDAEWVTRPAPAPGAPLTIKYTPMFVNGYALGVYAVDRAGNRSEMAGYDFWVRDTRVTTYSTAYPTGDAVNLDYNVGVPGEFTFDGSDDIETIEWRIEDGPSGRVKADANGDATVLIAPTKAGPNRLEAWGVTAGGSAYPDNAYTFTVDDGPTVTTDVERPWIGSTVKVTAKPRTAGVVAYDYWLFSHAEGGGVPRPVTVPAKADHTAEFRFTVTDFEQQGLYVQSRTADGTTSVARYTSLPAEGAEPQVRRTGGDEPGTTATFVASTDMVGVAKYTIELDGVPARTLPAAADGTVRFEHPVTRTGPHQLRIWATNAAGIRTATGGTTWTVSNGPKITSAEFPATGAGRLVPGTFTFTPRLPVVTHYEYSINNGPLGKLTAKADGTATLGWTPAAAGTYTLLTRSYNGSASSQLTTYKFRVAPAAVKVASVGPATVTTGAVRTITLRGTALHRKDVLQVTPAGGRAVTATVRSVSADGTTMTADVNLTGAPAGPAAVALRPFGAGQPVVSLARAFTVALQPGPRATKRPAVSGTPMVGAVLRATPGAWTPAATAYRYQWAANGVAIKGATGASLTVPAAAAGKRLTVTVTALRTGHHPGTAASAATAAVAKGKAPKATRKPTATGTAKAGKTLTANAGTWSPKADSYRYEWRLNGKVIKGATARTLKLKSAWRGKRVTVTVTAKRAGHLDGRATSSSVLVR